VRGVEREKDNVGKEKFAEREIKLCSRQWGKKKEEK
jgi:hypothetical protein